MTKAIIFFFAGYLSVYSVWAQSVELQNEGENGSVMFRVEHEPDLYLPESESKLEICFFIPSGEVAVNMQTDICINSDTICFKTDSTGYFSRSLKPGKYNIQVLSQWFQPVSTGKLRLKPSEKTIITIYFKPIPFVIGNIYFDM